MIIKNLLVTIFLIGLISCKSKIAFNYSEDFVKKEQSLGAEITRAEQDVSAFNAKGEYDSIAVIGSQMEKIFDIKIKEIEDKPAPDVKEGENFKNACISYFKFFKSIYTDYKDYGNAKTMDERDMILNKIRNNVANKENAIANIKQAQQKFAAANGFKIKD